MLIFMLLQITQEIPYIPSVEDNIFALKAENGMLRWVIYIGIAAFTGLFGVTMMLLNKLLNRGEKDADKIRENINR